MNKKIELFNEMLDLYEFTLIHHDDNTWGLHDRQCGNLGDIESDRFDTLTDIIERLEAYHLDYIVNAVEESFDIYDYTDYLDLATQCREKIATTPLEYADFSEWDLELLELIGNAPNIDICNAPLDDVALQGLDYENWE
jgi:hypothetical protein